MRALADPYLICASPVSEYDTGFTALIIGCSPRSPYLYFAVMDLADAGSIRPYQGRMLLSATTFCL